MCSSDLQGTCGEGESRVGHAVEASSDHGVHTQRPVEGQMGSGGPIEEDDGAGEYRQREHRARRQWGARSRCGALDRPRVRRGGGPPAETLNFSSSSLMKADSFLIILLYMYRVQKRHI